MSSPPKLEKSCNASSLRNRAARRIASLDPSNTYSIRFYKNLLKHAIWLMPDERKDKFKAENECVRRVLCRAKACTHPIQRKDLRSLLYPWESGEHATVQLPSADTAAPKDLYSECFECVHCGQRMCVSEMATGTRMGGNKCGAHQVICRNPACALKDRVVEYRFVAPSGKRKQQ